MQFRCLLKFMTWLLTESPEYKTKQIPDPSLPHNLICCVKPMATAPYSPYTANKVCPLVQQNTPCCLPSDTGSHRCSCKIWLDCQEKLYKLETKPSTNLLHQRAPIFNSEVHQADPSGKVYVGNHFT